MEYEWDEAKSVENFAKHDIDFTAMPSFEWNTAKFEFDDYYPEPRWKATGYIGMNLFRVVYTFRGENYRIISLRKATGREYREYAES